MKSIKFEFRENHRNISDDELINDIKNISNKLNCKELTTSRYNTYGKYHSSAICRRFGSWNKALEKANLKIKKEQRYQITKDELVQDIKLTAKKLNKDTMFYSEYQKYGKYSIKPILRVFGSWSNALYECGFTQTGFNRNISDLELFKDIEQMWTKKGSQPTTSDVRKGLSRYGLNTFCRRFGGWNNAMKAFTEYINSDFINNDYEKELLDNEIKPNSKQGLYNKRKTSRNINLRLRFKVFQRDNFKCCICGHHQQKIQLLNYM